LLVSLQKPLKALTLNVDQPIINLSMAYFGGNMDILEKFISWLGVSQNTDEFQWTKTPAYKKRLEWVKSTWIVAGIIMLIAASPVFIIASSFFLTFLSFAFLEKPS